jgi:transposase
MQAYSLDLRARVVSAYEKGDDTRAEIAVRVSVGQTFLKKMRRQERATGALARLPPRAGAKRGLSAPHRQWGARQSTDHPDTTLAELQERVSQAQQVAVRPATGCREVQELGVPRKKRRGRRRRATPARAPGCGAS